MNTQNPHTQSLRVLMLGATGAVGGHALRALQGMPVQGITVLGRRKVEGKLSAGVQQHNVDVTDPSTYKTYLSGHNSAVCTLGVGQPSKVSFEQFVAIDKDAVIAFALACKNAGVRHFELLAAVGANAQSRSGYLRTKGQLCDALQRMGFERLSIFMPSMILTPTNRYGLSQALLLKTWPLLTPLLLGPLRPYRGIEVQTLGKAMAANLFTPGQGLEHLLWDEFVALAPPQPPQ
jgi:uncharacterized protein YbjT (DUF2867 family)